MAHIPLNRLRFALAFTALSLPVAAYAQAQYDVLSLNSGDDSACHDYLIGDVATGSEIAAMLEDAAKGARAYGCVNIVVDHGQ
jgi:hypothetical protein